MIAAYFAGISAVIKQLEDGLRKFTEIPDETARKMAYFALKQMQRKLKTNRNIDTGYLRDSLDVVKQNYGTWAVGSKAKYMWYIEYGTRPHTPPLRPLVEWAARKNKLYGEKGRAKAYPIAKAVQRKIALKGTNPYPFIRPSAEEAVKFGKDLIRKLIRR